MTAACSHAGPLGRAGHHDAGLVGDRDELGPVADVGVEIVFAFDATTVDEVFVLGSVEGDLDSLGADGIAVSAEHAAEQGWTISFASRRHSRAATATTSSWSSAISASGTDWVGPMFVNSTPYGQAARSSTGSTSLATSRRSPACRCRRTRQGRLPRRRQHRDRHDAPNVLCPADARRRHRLARHRRHPGAVIFEQDPRLIWAVGMSRSQVRSTVRWKSSTSSTSSARPGLAIK